MIPRYQRVLFWILVSGIVLMAIVLVYEQRKNHDRFTAPGDATPIAAPSTSEAETITFYLADDSDGSIIPTQRDVALPQTPAVRARALLEHLLAEYGLPGSNHPLTSGPAVDDVFFVNLPLAAATGSDPSRLNPAASTGVLAVVNLRGSFASAHPSGVAVESLTLQSIIGTLHAAFPEITQVRFLVDGQARDTLAGHADLQRTYPALDTASKPIAPLPDPTDQP